MLGIWDTGDRGMPGFGDSGDVRSLQMWGHRDAGELRILGTLEHGDTSRKRGKNTT